MDDLLLLLLLLLWPRVVFLWRLQPPLFVVLVLAARSTQSLSCRLAHLSVAATATTASFVRHDDRLSRCLFGCLLPFLALLSLPCFARHLTLPCRLYLSGLLLLLYASLLLGLGLFIAVCEDCLIVPVEAPSILRREPLSLVSALVVVAVHDFGAAVDLPTAYHSAKEHTKAHTYALEMGRTCMYTYSVGVRLLATGI